MLLVILIQFDIINVTRMRYTEILIGSQDRFQLDFVHFLSPLVNMTLNNNSKYIRWSFSIGYLERYVNWTIDIL